MLAKRKQIQLMYSTQSGFLLNKIFDSNYKSIYKLTYGECHILRWNPDDL